MISGYVTTNICLFVCHHSSNEDQLPEEKTYPEDLSCAHLAMLARLTISDVMITGGKAHP